MKIKTKYDIGYEFYVPRVFTGYETDVIKHPDVNGIVRDYTCKIETLYATIRHKIVQKIEIIVYNDSTEIKYWCKNFDQQDALLTLYTDEEMAITDPNVALLFAKKWQNEQGREYYGSSSYDPEDHEE